MENKPDEIDKEMRDLHVESDNTEVVEPEIEDIETDGVSSEDGEADAAQMLAAQLEAAQAALEKEKKEYMFLMADFDNFRKRVQKEKAELLRNGAEKAMAGLLPIIDDFERGLEATKSVGDADAVRQGMELIYNKFIKYLEQNGVKAMESTGSDFDADVHDAIATIPAPSPELKGKVIDTTQKGYTINVNVLRHAKV
ncbi:MAG: nucleotide exchange factor GrpE, partial [Muribaculaceae bacterium]|nr:nucleotide exchange factor GrpE [Muribaculaceae bacterium]